MCIGYINSHLVWAFQWNFAKSSIFVVKLLFSVVSWLAFSEISLKFHKFYRQGSIWPGIFRNFCRETSRLLWKRTKIQRRKCIYHISTNYSTGYSHKFLKGAKIRKLKLQIWYQTGPVSSKWDNNHPRSIPYVWQSIVMCEYYNYITFYVPCFRRWGCSHSVGLVTH